ncbi:DUF222 domain-containing protein [Microbacterium sp. NPDC056052]|uniref:HNH endonuclease signature motif containing protein n=1 Tax=Microbacterium sp. NPDC056052 TaxID=3345695 RepID=UPI0035DBFBD2
MRTLDAIAALIPTLAGRIGAGAGASEVQAVVEGLADDAAVAVLREAGEVGRLVEQVQVICAGVIARRSSRDAGHTGLAQARGHRSAASLVQELGGMSKGEAARQVRVGEALLADDALVDGADPDPPDGGPLDEPIARDWRQVLREGLRSGVVTSAQFDAIRRGLGDPPEGADDAWAEAAAQLIDEAGRRTVEELAASARTIRDLLDPDGAEARFAARYEKRAFRTWFDQDGMRRASIAFDDEGGAFVDTIFNAALRPRRGGPRFVDASEKASAADLSVDPRTNDQLSYDLLLDLIRAGALADPAAVFGTRQAGLRLVQQITADGSPAAVAVTEDGLTALPATVAERHVCDAGTLPVTVDASGNPLDVGRESRLFTPTQRVGLAVRDGGCRWTGCDRPASYCEAHHIDEWARDDGHTNIDRGILLCRFHHMQLHHGRWHITRDGKHDFVLHHPGGEQNVLHPRLALKYAWGNIDPPPKRFHPTA